MGVPGLLSLIRLIRLSDLWVSWITLLMGVLDYTNLWVSWITVLDYFLHPLLRKQESMRWIPAFDRNGIGIRGVEIKQGLSLNGLPRLNRPCDRLLP